MHVQEDVAVIATRRTGYDNPFSQFHELVWCRPGTQWDGADKWNENFTGTNLRNENCTELANHHILTNRKLSYFVHNLHSVPTEFTNSFSKDM